MQVDEPDAGASAPPAPKRKLSRKKQIKELAKKRKEERHEEEYQPDPMEDERESDDEPTDLLVEEPGEASRRARVAYAKRLTRVRGLGNDAQMLGNWLASAPENQQHFINRAIAELALEVTSAAVATAVRTVEEEAERERRSHAAKLEAERRMLKKREQASLATPEVKALRPRTDAHPSTTSSTKSTQARAGDERAKLTDSMKAMLARVYKQKHLRREDVVGGGKISRSEWNAVRRDPK